MMAWLFPISVALTFCPTVLLAANSTGSVSDDDPLCNSTLSQANATGMFSFNPGTLIPSREPPPNVTWVATLQAGRPIDTTTQYEFWYNTGGENYSDSLSLGYDVCAIEFEPYAIYNNTDARSQYDDGTCTAAFDSDCIDALTQQSQDMAFLLTGSPSPLPNSNLTANSLPDVCNTLADQMSADLPKQCKPFINETRYVVYGQALTTNYDSEGLFFGNPGSACTMNTTQGSANETFNYVNGYDDSESSAESHVHYDRMSWEVLPTMTVFMPVANARRDVSMNYAVSVLRCLRITEFSEGSRVPAAAPQPTPISLGSKKLSSGAIAGIAVGSVAGVGLVVAAAVFWWLRKRKAKRNAETIVSAPHYSYPDEKKPPYDEVLPTEVDNDNALQKIDSRDPYKAELPDAASRDPVELAGSMPYGEGRQNRASRGYSDGVKTFSISE